jgi:hypothetical protein
MGTSIPCPDHPVFVQRHRGCECSRSRIVLCSDITIASRLHYRRRMLEHPSQGSDHRYRSKHIYHHGLACRFHLQLCYEPFRLGMGNIQWSFLGESQSAASPVSADGHSVAHVSLYPCGPISGFRKLRYVARSVLRSMLIHVGTIVP